MVNLYQAADSLVSMNNLLCETSDNTGAVRHSVAKIFLHKIYGLHKIPHYVSMCK